MNSNELLYGLKSFTYSIGELSRFAKLPTYSKYFNRRLSPLSINYNIEENYNMADNYIDFLQKLNYKLFDKISFYLDKKDIVKIYDLIKIKITNKGFIFDFSNLEKYICSTFNITIDKLEDIKDDEQKIEKILKNNNKINHIVNTRSEKLNVCTFDILAKRKIIYRRIVSDILEILSGYKYMMVSIDILNKDKIKADMADKMYNVAIKNEKKKNLDYFTALKYLVNYYNDNKNNYGNFHLSKISTYLNKIKDKKKKEKTRKKKQVDKYNYNFFEEDVEFSKEILSHVTKLNNPKNTDKLKKILERKLDLYNSIGYSKIKIGKNSYDGYIGFVIDNKVILDRLFSDLNSYTIAIDNAIYIVNENDFDEITKMSKQKVIEAINNNLIDAKRIIHNGKYESKVLEYIKNNLY